MLKMGIILVQVGGAVYVDVFVGTCGGKAVICRQFVKFIGVVGGAVYEPRVRFPMGILGFFIDLILPACKGILKNKFIFKEKTYSVQNF
jgi:hypothetical protein